MQKRSEIKFTNEANSPSSRLAVVKQRSSCLPSVFFNILPLSSYWKQPKENLDSINRVFWSYHAKQMSSKEFWLLNLFLSFQPPLGIDVALNFHLFELKEDILSSPTYMDSLTKEMVAVFGILRSILRLVMACVGPLPLVKSVFPFGMVSSGVASQVVLARG
ncbi:hypothetical protein Vadar_002213 [Vaccinium darrowii]|uniref:Uncharacterized protein n=1 Tax=Vaccinium darrowii TaxID=229202 RepID=A0ACB7YJ18_9ERIC|nr:hypothetical protein Vadar_002213 [Vaccinium darrowii]